MKSILRIFLLFLTVGLAFLYFQDSIAKRVVEKKGDILTGLSIKVDEAKPDLVAGEIVIRGVRVLNPTKGYEQEAMVEAPEVRAAFGLANLFRSGTHLQSLEVYVGRFFIVKNSMGRVNIDPLLKGKVKPPENVRIDSLSLIIDKVVYIDHSRRGKPFVKEFKVNFKKTYKNVKDPKEFTRPLLANAMKLVSLADLTKIDLKSPASPLLSISETTGKTTLSETASLTKTTLAKTGKTVVGTAEKAVKKIE